MRKCRIFLSYLHYFLKFAEQCRLSWCILPILAIFNIPQTHGDRTRLVCGPTRKRALFFAEASRLADSVVGVDIRLESLT